MPGKPELLRPICCKVGEGLALELDAGLGGAFAGLEFVQGGFGAVDEGVVINNRGVEGPMSSRRLVSVDEEIRVLDGEGAGPVEQRLLGLLLLAERKSVGRGS